MVRLTLPEIFSILYVQGTEILTNVIFLTDKQTETAILYVRYNANFLTFVFLVRQNVSPLYGNLLHSGVS